MNEYKIKFAEFNFTRKAESMDAALHIARQLAIKSLGREGGSVCVNVCEVATNELKDLEVILN